MSAIKNFTDLLTWQKGHSLVLFIYKITKNFPNDERFGLTSQIQRAAVSITSNIAEGFGRRTLKEKTQFYSISRGSIAEVQNQLIISKDLKYITEGNYKKIHILSIDVYKLLNALIKKTKEAKDSSNE